jgi:hypothetical protein
VIIELFVAAYIGLPCGVFFKTFMARNIETIANHVKPFGTWPGIETGPLAWHAAALTDQPSTTTTLR